LKIGIISDSHDNKDNIIKTVSLINERKLDMLIHCGDYIAPFVKKWFDKLDDSIKKNFYGVFGNNDGERLFLKKNLGQICQFAENSNELILECDGKKIFATHMLKTATIEALANSGNFDIILYGHTHQLQQKKMDSGVLILNPGEICGYLTGNSTFALIETNKMEIEIITL